MERVRAMSIPDQGRAGAEVKLKSTQSSFYELNVVLLVRSLPLLGEDELEKERLVPEKQSGAPMSLG